MKEESKSAKKGVYLLPNLLTSCGLFSGFYSIVATMQHNFELACITIFIAMIFDSLDGRVARLTNSQSAFGAEYDSITDMVAFGVAPALLVYTWSIYSLGKIGWLCAFCYVAGAAMRLARFNTQLDESDKNYFSGLASTAAAGFITGFVWVMREYGYDDGVGIAQLVAAVVVITGYLMVSNLRYHSFKVLEFKGKVPFTVLIAFVFIVIAIAIDPAQVLFYAFVVYVVVGPIVAAFNKKNKTIDSSDE